MSNPSIADLYKYAALSTASYVRIGNLVEPLRTNGNRFADQAQGQGRLPISLGTALFNPTSSDAPRWDILSYYGDDAPEFAADKSGFGATLFQDSATGEKVLALRGTEPLEEPRPGASLLDRAVDLLSADLGQIGIFGIALTQVVSMANYIMRLKASSGVFVPQLRIEATLERPSSGAYLQAARHGGGLVYLKIEQGQPLAGFDNTPILKPGDVVRVTGHSLGGHLAVMAARLFPDLFDRNVVVFNSAGYDPTIANLLGFVQELERRFAGSLPGVNSIDFITGIFRSRIASEIGDAAGQLATEANLLSHDAIDKINAALGRSVSQGAPIVTSLRSEDLLPGDDTSLVASSVTGAEKYGPWIDLPTENNNHIIEPFMDALALQALIEPMTGTQFGTEQLTSVLRAAANDNKRSYEELTEGLFHLFLKGEPFLDGKVTLPISDEFSSFQLGKGNIEARNIFHDAVLRMRAALQNKPGLRLLSLVESSAQALNDLAVNVDPDAAAYRYALQALDPFAVVGLPSLYESHNQNGELNRYVSVDVTPAGMTNEYLADRSAMLAWLKIGNAQDEAGLIDDTFTDGADFRDLPGGKRIQIFNDTTVASRQFVFGGGGAEVLQGGVLSDRLYGGLGVDLLIGGTGDDHLEGGAGTDVYQYNGTQGLLGGLSNDGADEVRDTDGKGRLRYTFTEVGFLSDTVQSRVVGPLGLKVNDTQWQSPDGKFTFAQQFAGLLVTINGDAGGSIRVLDFDYDKAKTSGYLGIRLVDQLSAPDSLARTFHGDRQDWDSDPVEPGVQIQIDAYGNEVRADGQEGRPDLPQTDRADTFYGSSGEEGEKFATAGGDDVVYGDGPSSFTSSSGGRDLIETGAGRDVVTAGAGNDWIEGGSGGDVLGGNLGDDTLFGDSSAGQVWTLAQAIAFGESGAQAASPADLLTGDAGNDVVVGAATADLVYGGEGADVIVGGAGADNIYGDGAVTAAALDWQATRGITGSGEVRIYQLSTSGLVASNALDKGSADTIYGGAGADWIFAGAGDDYVEGGNSAGDANVDDDVLFGEAGSDILIGGSGKDSLHGDSASVDALGLSGDDYLEGGAGDDELIGYKGDDILIGGEGRDTLIGGEGDDLVWGGPGDDIVLSGPGKDSFVYHRGDGKDEVRLPAIPSGGGDFLDSLVLGPGIAKSDVEFRPGSLVVDLGEGGEIHFEGFDPDDPRATPVLGSIQFADGEVMTYEDILAQGITIDGTESDDREVSFIEGTEIRDLIDAKAGDDVVLAKGGDDEVLGGAGDDELDAGEGDDLVDGGDGADSIEGRGGNDVLAGGEGDDFVSGGAGDDEVDGGIGADTLLGGAGADTLSGGAGDDVLDGAGGNDALAGGDGVDSYVFQGRSGIDVVTDGEGGETNVIQLGAGLTLDNIAATRDGDALRISLRGLSDALLIQDYYTRAQSWVVRQETGTDTAIEDVIDRPDPHAGDFVARLWADAKLGHVADVVGLMVNEIGWKPLGGLTFQSIAESARVDATSQTTTETFTRFEPPHEVLASNVTFTSEHEIDGFGSLNVPLLHWSQTVFETSRQESDAGAIFGLPIGMPQEQYPGQQALVTLKLDPHLFNVQHTQSSQAGGVVSYDTGAETLLATVTYEYDIRHYKRSGRVVEVDADPGPWGPPLNTVVGNRVLVNMTQVVDRYRLVNEIVAGDSANLIFTGHEGDLIFRMKTLVDAGGGDDQVFGSGLLYGNSGADRIEGAGSVLIGGDGADELIGRDGSRFVYLATEAGIDRVSEITEYEQAYLGWFYGNLGIADWEYRAEHGGEYAVADGEGGLDHFDTYEEAFAVHPHGEITFVEPLPAAPAVRREDTAALDSLIEAGVMPRDVVQFGPGLGLADLDLAVTVPGFVADEHPEDPWFGGGTLSVRWGSAGFDLELPAVADYRVGEGIESFEFAGGARYSLETILEAAAVIPRYEHDFRRGSGEQIIDPRSPEVMFELGIAVADVAITREGLDLVLRLNDFSASGRIEGWFADPANMPGIGLRFADGFTISAAEVTTIALTQQGSPFDDVLQSIDGFANRLQGMGGNDVLHGANGEDVLEGGEGDDDLDGAAGKDTYVFNRGDGVDTVSDASSGDDASVIVFGPEVHPGQIQLGLGSLVVNYGLGDAIHFSAFDPDDPYAAPAFERLEFDDGSSLSYQEVLDLGFQFLGTEGDDVIIATGLRDFMAGGEGSDTYIYAPGDGHDQIADWDEALDDVDTLQLTGGILPAEVRVTRDDWSYYLVFGAADRLVLDSVAREPRAEIERIEFDDGTLWTTADLAARVELLPGTERADVLWGTAGADTLEALAGDDSLFGNAGNDFLAGGEGSDFYYFAAGDGADVVDNFDTDGSFDSIFFADAPSTDATLARSANDLVIRIGGGSDRVTLAGWYGDPSRKIDDVSFAGDGVFWDAATLEALAPLGSDRLIGTRRNDVLIGTDADEFLDGRGGNDKLSGGAGKDVYFHGLRGGHDKIDEAGAAGELDVLRFGEGITRHMVRARRHRDDLVLDLSGPHGSVTIKGWFGSSEQRVERIEFADGSSWDERAIRKAVRHGHDDDCHEPACDHHRRDERRDRVADERGSHRDERPVQDGAAAISERLSQSLSFDFEALARELERPGREEKSLTPQQIQRQWAAVQRYVSALALEGEEDDAGAGGWRNFSTASFLGTGSFGFEASTGAARGPGNLKSLEGLGEGFRRL